MILIILLFHNLKKFLQINFFQKIFKLRRRINFVRFTFSTNKHLFLINVKEIKEKIASKIKKINNNFSDFVCLIFFNIFKIDV